MGKAVRRGAFGRSLNNGLFLAYVARCVALLSRETVKTSTGNART
jgi:hypothetical protein